MKIFDTQVQPLFESSILFLESIGIKVVFNTIAEPTFLPGIFIKNGGLIIDANKIKFAGDVLHEAGHIAIVPANERTTLCEHDIALRPQREAEEMMAIAWSYAACVHLSIDARFVFHDDGYNGSGSSIAENFDNKQYFGVPMLQWTGMTREEKNAKPGEPFYPEMIQWLRP